MTRPPAVSLLIRAGEALYGPRWQTELARDLGVSDRTMRRWASGAYDLPPSVYADLSRIAQARASALADIARKIAQEMERVT